MSFRNLSPQRMFEQLALEHEPRSRFSAESAEQFEHWRDQTLPRVIATLGTMPPRVPPAPQQLAEWTEGGLTRQKWLIDVGPHIAATLLVNLPPDGGSAERSPAILCAHGHGPYGKSAIMGNGAAGGELRDYIARNNANFGFQMAQRGYVTYSIDWIGFGERNDSAKPNWRNTDHGRDWCNLYYLNATMLGMTPLGINVTHGIAATDFVASLPHVDPQRLGVMGISGGGTMALWLSLCDPRFRATEIICYSDLWAHFGFRDLNYCGVQVAPSLYQLADLPDLQGLLAPRPLLIDIGAEDPCFLVDTALACYRRVEHIYHTAGAADRLRLDLFPGGHRWGGNLSHAFFETHLGPGAGGLDRR